MECASSAAAFGGFETLGVASLIEQARLQNFTVIVVFRDSTCSSG